MRLTARRRALAGLLLVALPAAGLLAAAVVQAQQDGFVEEIDLDVANCFGHHAAESPPFRTTVIIVPQAIAEVPAGQEFDLPVQVQVAWKQEMRNLKVGINISGAPNLGFIGEKDPVILPFPGETVNQGQSVQFPFLVEDNATEIVVTLDGDPGPTLNDLDLILVSPGASLQFNKTIEDTSFNEGQQGDPIADEQVRLNQADILDGGLGEWLAVVTFASAGPGLPTVPVLPATFDLNLEVYYNASRQLETFVPVGRTLAAGEIANVTFRMRALAAGPATIGVRSLGWAHYLHTDAQATDDGNFSKVQTMDFLVGSTFRVQQGGAGLVDVGFDPLTKTMRQWGFLLGWLGFFLVPPSLLLGGTFGGASVRALNKRVGSARQRVLWHNALSYVLLAVALTHMTLFLVEVTYAWTVGIVWGGLTLAAMIGLAITGALQTRIAKTWGYATWRFTHFLMGMLVVAFVALHVVVDGVDLQFLRDYFLAR